METDTPLDHKPKTGALILLTIYFGVIFGMQIVWVIDETLVPDWTSTVYLLLSYLIVALLIWAEKDHLSDFHIDRLSLVIFLLFGSLLRLIDASNSTLHCASALSFILIAFLLFMALRRSKTQVTGTPKIGLWILAGVLVPVLLFFISLGIFNSLTCIHSDTLSVFSTYLLYHLGNVAITEEPVFRGFLWGYLRELGYRDERLILLLQAALFAFGHLDDLTTHPFSFWVLRSLPGLLWGLLAWKSRSVAPSMVSHALLNALGSIIRRCI